MNTPAYLATPYTRRSDRYGAYIEACALTARLMQAGIKVFCPIAHSHGISVHGKIDDLDEHFWQQQNEPMLHVCRTLIVGHLEGWDESAGIAHEVAFFEKRGRPIFDCDPLTLKLTRRRVPESVPRDTQSARVNLPRAT